MSIEIVLYPNGVTQDALCEYLVESGFQSCEHLWDWPEKSRHFIWFDEDDFRSFLGVEATIYPTTGTEHEEHPDASWGLHTRTRASASSGDRAQQNHVIRLARKRFGGSFTNDWYGKNRYTPIPPDPRDAVARGIYLSYQRVKEQISAVRTALPEPVIGFDRLVGTDFEALARYDPTRVIYNALVPFAIAALEHFFSQCFKILLKYDGQAQKRLMKQSRKVDLGDVLAIRDGKNTIENLVARRYSFQSISGISAAFKDLLDIDFQAVVSRRKKVGKRLLVLERQLNSLIEFRHGIVHRFNLDLELRKEHIEEILDLVTAVIDQFVEHLEKLRSVSIRVDC